MAVSQKIDDLDELITLVGDERWYTLPIFYHVEFLDEKGRFAGFLPVACTTKKEAEMLVAKLKEKGYNAAVFMHIN